MRVQRNQLLQIEASKQTALGGAISIKLSIPKLNPIESFAWMEKVCLLIRTMLRGVIEKNYAI